MALQTSGPISLDDIQTEFGGTNPIDISDYYRNGDYVTNATANQNIPESGEISLSDFYGATRGIEVTVTQANPSLEYKGAALYGESAYIAGGILYDVSPNTYPAFGSMSPATYEGATIQGLYENHDYPGAFDDYYFMFILSGTRAKSFFTELQVEGVGTLTSASATHVQSTSSTIWYWAISNSAEWNGSNTSTVLIV